MSGRRLLDVTARTTFDRIEATATGESWTEDGVAVLDVESPSDEDAVTLGLELDPSALEQLPHHAERVSLSPEEARQLAAELTSAAAAAERGEARTSGRW